MKSLNEQRKRMRELMGFTYKDNSHDLLSEENFNSIEVVENHLLTEQGGEPDWEWIKKELEKEKVIKSTKPECFMVGSAANRIKGVFEAAVTEGSTAVTDFVKVLMEKIKNNENAKKYLGKGGKFTIEEMDIIAGASNSLNGSVTPTMDNNYKPLNITKGSADDKKYKFTIGTDTYNKNMGYAKARGEGVKNGLIKAFSTINGFDLSGDKIKISNHIIDTGGKIDKDSTSPNEGQVALVFMKVCWVNTTQTRVPAVVKEFNRCMTGLSIIVGFNKRKQGRVTHRCDNAVFKIYVNGVPVKRTGFAKGSQPSSFPSKAGEYADLNNASTGGSRWNEFALNSDEVAALVKLDVLKKYKGEIQVQAKCIPQSSQTWKDKRDRVYVPNKGIELPKTGMVLYKTPDGPKRQYLDTGKSGGYAPIKKWIAVAIKYADPQSGILPTTTEGYIPENILEELKIKEYNTTWDEVYNNEESKNILYDFYKNSGKIKANENKGQKGCHEGVAEVVLNYQGQPQESSTVTTPRFESGGVINLGAPMEGCKKQWVELVDASKKKSFDVKDVINTDIPSVLNKG